MKIKRSDLNYLIETFLSQKKYSDGDIVTTSPSDEWEYKYENGIWKTRKKNTDDSWIIIKDESAIADLSSMFLDSSGIDSDIDKDTDADFDKEMSSGVYMVVFRDVKPLAKHAEYYLKSAINVSYPYFSKVFRVIT